MKIGVWRFVLENADGEIRKVEVVSTSGKAAKARITTGESILSMKRLTWVSGYDEETVCNALATVMTRGDAEVITDVLKYCGVFGEFYGADEM